MRSEHATKQYEVGAGLDYVKGQLAIGGGLASMLLHRPLDEGRLITFLPERLPDWTFEDFDSGPISIEYGPYMTEGPYPDTVSPVAEYVAGFLGKSGQPRYAVFEDPVATSTDPFLARIVDPFFECFQHIYWFAPGPCSPEAARRLLHRGSWYPGIGVLTWLTANPDPVRDRAVVNESVLTELAENAACILVQAWDQEGWLLWQAPAD